MAISPERHNIKICNAIHTPTVNDALEDRYPFRLIAGASIKGGRGAPARFWQRRRDA